jgi:hypothetical protein
MPRSPPALLCSFYCREKPQERQAFIFWQWDCNQGMPEGMDPHFS